MHSNSDPVIIGMADQLDAELRDARLLAPYNRFMLADPQTRPVLDQALRGREGPRVDGICPVIWFGASVGISTSAEYERDGSKPLVSSAPVQRCNVCNAYMAPATAFWVARGQYIVQIDTCDACGARLIARGAVRQVGE